MDDITYGGAKIADCLCNHGRHIYVKIPGKGWFMLTVQDLPRVVDIDGKKIASLMTRTQAQYCHACGMELNAEDMPLRNYVKDRNVPVDEMVERIIAE